MHCNIIDWPISFSGGTDRHHKHHFHSASRREGRPGSYTGWHTLKSLLKNCEELIFFLEDCSKGEKKNEEKNPYMYLV